MRKSQPDINLVVHFPKTDNGWKILVGRMTLFNQLVMAQEKGEKINLDYEVSRFTTEDALEAYRIALRRYKKTVVNTHRHPYY